MLKEYGVFYTPTALAEFTASLIEDFSSEEVKNKKILDPSSGEGALLKAAKKQFGSSNEFLGIDVDEEAVKKTYDEFSTLCNDTLLPKGNKDKTMFFWEKTFGKLDLIISNPPWSTERIYDKYSLINAGFSLVDGQYDSYVLFIELSLQLLKEDGIMAFIIPDSLFESQNEKLRQLLTEETQILLLARLGEKIFDNVNRATTILICKKKLPTDDSITKCFRLTSDDRKLFLKGEKTLREAYEEEVHEVKQSRFKENSSYNFNIDTRENEETLISKISENCFSWDEEFIFGRGVEISKKGRVIFCNHCGLAQGISRKQELAGEKICNFCKQNISVKDSVKDNIITDSAKNDTIPIIVGEDVNRFTLKTENHIKVNVPGINYKDSNLYKGDKLLIRKTGLGIYASIDYLNSYTNQTVYTLKSHEKSTTPLEYTLALMNSRVVYYFYLKTYGEVEWKSHPYLTKKIIYSLPLKRYEGMNIDLEIVKIVKNITKNYSRKDDIYLEKLIMDKYGLQKKEREIIIKEINNLPNLESINNLKIEESEWYV